MDASPDIISILLIDPNVLFRCGIARLLEAQPDMRIVGETGDYHEALSLAGRLNPDVILLEIELIGGDGPTLAGILSEELPCASLVFLTAQIDADTLLRCIQSGATGYLQKTITPEELFARLRGLQQREAAISLTTVTTLMQRLSANAFAALPPAVPHSQLTPRECEVIALVARGMTNKRMAVVLGISEHTVRNHLCSIYQKLNLKNRLQVAVYSVTHGLVDFSQVG